MFYYLWIYDTVLKGRFSGRGKTVGSQIGLCSPMFTLSKLEFPPKGLVSLLGAVMLYQIFGVDIIKIRIIEVGDLRS